MVMVIQQLKAKVNQCAFEKGNCNDLKFHNSALHALLPQFSFNFQLEKMYPFSLFIKLIRKSFNRYHFYFTVIVS